MKRKIQIFTFLALSLLLITNCSKKSDDNVTPTTDSNSKSSKIKLNASGTVSYDYNASNYSLNVDSVTWSDSYKTYITIYSHNADPYLSLIINAYDLDGVKTSKDYSAASSSQFSILTGALADGIYQASSVESGSSCTVNFSEISSTAIKGTFSGKLSLYSTTSSGSATITNGIINITVK